MNIKFPFSANISWKLNGSIIIPKTSLSFLNNANKIFCICSGYLLECITCSYVNKLFLRNNIKIDEWIMPDYYSDALKIFGLRYNYKKLAKNIFLEFSEINNVASSYPVPIFMDADNNVYFNLLFNYCEVFTKSGMFVRNNVEPFWKQILSNTCINYENEIFCNDFTNFINKNKLLSELKIDNDNFVVIDCVNLFNSPLQKKPKPKNFFSPDEIRQFAKVLLSRKIKCVVMTNNPLRYAGINIQTIYSWNNINSLHLISLLHYARGIISEDHNLYLLAPILNCNSTFCVGNQHKGFSFSDLDGICINNNTFIIENYNKLLNFIEVM